MRFVYDQHIVVLIKNSFVEGNLRFVFKLAIIVDTGSLSIRTFCVQAHAVLIRYLTPTHSRSPDSDVNLRESLLQKIQHSYPGTGRKPLRTRTNTVDDRKWCLQGSHNIPPFPTNGS